MEKRGLVWFRKNLRVHDNECLYKAAQENDALLCIYCISPEFFTDHSLLNGFYKNGMFRRRFLLESLNELSKQLRRTGGDLSIIFGKPEVVIPDLLSKYKLNTLYYQEETTYEEVQEQKLVEQSVNKQMWSIKSFLGHTLIHLEDLPFSINNLPDIFTQFRKTIEKETEVRQEYPIPAISKPIVTGNEFELVPNDLQIDKDVPQAGSLPFRGGESAAWERLNHYFWKHKLLSKYKYTRNELLGTDYSSKFSPWLANGCLSPRSIYWQVKKYEQEVTSNSSTYWLVFELFWRDYFWFIARKYGNRLFYKKGIKNKDLNTTQKQELFQKWVNGETGIPFIDANMRELKQTGYMSNRGRQNVASFLVKDLQLDWRIGAAYFESLLIDYDVCSNWGNWQYVAGIGNDPRENRYFNIISQARKYDFKGEYIKKWIPELSGIEGFSIHQPSTLNQGELLKAGVTPGVTYPNPVIDISHWVY